MEERHSLLLRWRVGSDDRCPHPLVEAVKVVPLGECKPFFVVNLIDITFPFVARFQGQVNYRDFDFNYRYR